MNDDTKILLHAIRNVTADDKYVGWQRSLDSVKLALPATQKQREYIEGLVTKGLRDLKLASAVLKKAWDRRTTRGEASAIIDALLGNAGPESEEEEDE